MSSRSGRAGGRSVGRASARLCGSHISETAGQIFPVRSSMELSRPEAVHCHGRSPISPIWTCPWGKNMSNLAHFGYRLCGTHISETAEGIYSIQSSMELSRPVGVQRHGHLPICPIWACPRAKTCQIKQHWGPDLWNTYL